MPNSLRQYCFVLLGFTIAPVLKPVMAVAALRVAPASTLETRTNSVVPKLTDAEKRYLKRAPKARADRLNRKPGF